MTVTELLAELIARPSLNPGDTDDPSLVGEERVAAFLETHLQDLGFRTERHPYQPGRDNVIARIGGSERVLMIEGHMDTVAVDGMVVPPFEATERDGRIYGRGACDTKGPSATAITAFTPRVLEAARTSSRGLMYVAACAEEKGCFGAAALAESGIGADEAIVLEPTQLVPVIAHKGSLWLQIALSGRACHGSQPELGINAIEAAAEFIRFLHEDFRFAHPPDEFLGANTINTGRIRGGRAANIVPDACELDIDIRTGPAEDHQALTDQVRSELERLQQAGRLLGFELVHSRCPSFSTRPDSQLARRLTRASRRAPVGTSWMSDACPLSATCPEIAVFGPGQIEQAHTKDESIGIAELERGVAAFETIYLDFLDA